MIIARGLDDDVRQINCRGVPSMNVVVPFRLLSPIEIDVGPTIQQTQKKSGKIKSPRLLTGNIECNIFLEYLFDRLQIIIDYLTEKCRVIIRWSNDH